MTARPVPARGRYPYRNHRTLAEVWATRPDCERCGRALASPVHQFGCKDKVNG